jgi:hypothetical protein
MSTVEQSSPALDAIGSELSTPTIEKTIRG